MPPRRWPGTTEAFWVAAGPAETLPTRVKLSATKVAVTIFILFPVIRTFISSSFFRIHLCKSVSSLRLIRLPSRLFVSIRGPFCGYSFRLIRLAFLQELFDFFLSHDPALPGQMDRNR